MSYRVGTPNYNLPQTEGTDKRDWSDTNQAFLAIDTAIKGAVDTSASASAAASNAQTSADNAGIAAAHAQTDATTAQTLATSASEAATLAKSTADDAQTGVDAINSKLTNRSKSVSVTTDAHISGASASLVKYGNICDFTFSATCTLGLPYTSWFSLGTLPADARPIAELSIPVVFSTNGQVNAECAITPNGEVRFRCMTGSVTLPAFLKIHTTYLAA